MGTLGLRRRRPEADSAPDNPVVDGWNTTTNGTGDG
jgi:hypothetical protein